MARCSLMANGQKGDIECSYVDPPIVSGASKLYTGKRLRLRLSREDRTLEISQYRPYNLNSKGGSQPRHTSIAPQSCSVGGGFAGEWVKRVISTPMDGYEDLPGLGEDIQSAFNHLLDCKKICEKVEEALPSLQARAGQLVAEQNLTEHRKKEQQETNFKPRIFTRNPDSNFFSSEAPKAHSHKLAKPMLVGLGLPSRPRRISVSQGSLKDKLTSPNPGKRSVHWGADVRETYEPE